VSALDYRIICSSVAVSSSLGWRARRRTFVRGKKTRAHKRIEKTERLRREPIDKQPEPETKAFRKNPRAGDPRQNPRSKVKKKASTRGGESRAKRKI
jgi:hypothetical protein